MLETGMNTVRFVQLFGPSHMDAAWDMQKRAELKSVPRFHWVLAEAVAIRMSQALPQTSRIASDTDDVTTLGVMSQKLVTYPAAMLWAEVKYPACGWAMRYSTSALLREGTISHMCISIIFSLMRCTHYIIGVKPNATWRQDYHVTRGEVDADRDVWNVSGDCWLLLAS